MNSKILQVIPSRGLLAVIGDFEGFYTVRVSHIRLVEHFQQGSNGNHKIIRREQAIIPFGGRLIACDEVPDCLGIADGEMTARHLWVQSLTEDEYKAYQERTRREAIDNAPCSFTEMTRRHEAWLESLKQADMIPTGAN